MPQGLLPFSSEHPHQRIVDSKPGCFTRNKRRLFYLLDGNPRRLKTISILLLFLCCILYLSFFFFVSNSDVIEESPNIMLSDFEIEKRLDFETVTIDKICSKLSSICYSIVDKKSDSGIVQRHLIFDHGLPEESDTMVALFPPRGESFDTSDTRIWNINHVRPISQYIAAMVVAPFITGTLPFQENNADKSVLEIGLGGGSLDMALHRLKPQINITVVEKDDAIVQIAEKWFGVTNDDHRKSIVSDGVHYLNRIVSKKETVDVIMLDACDDNKVLPCPSATFRQREAIQLLKSAVKPTGVVVVNILAYEEDETKPVYSSKVISALSEVFSSCIQLKMTNEVNKILICSPDSVMKLDSQIESCNEHLKTIVSSLDYKYILGDVTVSAVP